MSINPIENIPAIHNKEYYYNCEKEYRQSAQEAANEAVEYAKEGDWEQYHLSQAAVDHFVANAQDCGQRVELFNK